MVPDGCGRLCCAATDIVDDEESVLPTSAEEKLGMVLELELELGDTESIEIGRIVFPSCFAGAGAAAVVDVMNVVSLGCEIDNVLDVDVDIVAATAVSTASVLINIDSSADFVFFPLPLPLALAPTLLLAPGNVTEISDGKILNVNTPGALEDTDTDTGAEDNASAAAAELDTVIGTIGARVEGASEPVIVVIDGFIDSEGGNGETAGVLVSVRGGTIIVSAAPEGEEIDEEREIELELKLGDGADGATIVVVVSLIEDEDSEEVALLSLAVDVNVV